MKIDLQLGLADLKSSIDRFWEVSREKIRAIEKNFDPAKGAPVLCKNKKKKKKKKNGTQRLGVDNKVSNWALTITV